MLAIGKAAAAEAAANVEKSVEDKDDINDDAQARYYRCGALTVVSFVRFCRWGSGSVGRC